MSIDDTYDLFSSDNGFGIQKERKHFNIFKDIFKDTLMVIMKVRFNRVIWHLVTNEKKEF